ncbi:MAG: hypothetical protein V9G29_00925 [Burkholderiaceae bacterium]
MLAGFYDEPLSFVFPPAFMREARIRIAAQWLPQRSRGGEGRWPSRAACRWTG